MEADTPIIAPATPAVTYDQVLAQTITIRYLPSGRWMAGVELAYYTDVNGERFFATIAGRRVLRRIIVPDVLAEAAETPELAAAFSALETAIAALVAKGKAQ